MSPAHSSGAACVVRVAVRDREAEPLVGDRVLGEAAVDVAAGEARPADRGSRGRCGSTRTRRTSSRATGRRRAGRPARRGRRSGGRGRAADARSRPRRRGDAGRCGRRRRPAPAAGAGPGPARARPPPRAAAASRRPRRASPACCGPRRRSCHRDSRILRRSTRPPASDAAPSRAITPASAPVNGRVAGAGGLDRLGLRGLRGTRRSRP